MGNNPRRHELDIKNVSIHTSFNGTDDWFVEIFYKDGKQCSFTIDAPANLSAVMRAIKLQLSGKWS
jgi:hypothetical protein